MLAIDGAELQRRFYALAREHHPDFHQAAPPEERARVEATAAIVNAAYRTLRDPIARVDYLVRLEEGRETKEGARSEEHTSELQSPCNLVCRLLLEKKKK